MNERFRMACSAGWRGRGRLRGVRRKMQAAGSGNQQGELSKGLQAASGTAGCLGTENLTAAHNKAAAIHPLRLPLPLLGIR